MNGSTSLSLQLVPHLPLAPAIGHLVKDFFEETVGERHAAGMRLIAQELVENAVVHASGGDLRLEIDVVPDGEGFVVRVATWNRADDERVRRVRETLASLDGVRDLSAPYEARMHNVATRPGVPGLGLMRVRAECKASLAFEVDGTGVLHVVAEARIPR